MGLAIQSNNIGVYKACIKDAKSFKDLTSPFLFSNINELNLESVPKHLPILTSVEEMLIAHVYIYLQVVCVRGQ